MTSKHKADKSATTKGERLNSPTSSTHIVAAPVTVFKVNTDGTGFTNLYSFTGDSDGGSPAELILSGNTLYGLAEGGSSGHGSLFAINTDGSGFTNLYSFTGGSDGFAANAIIISGNTLYGATSGSLFIINTDGSGFTNLYSGSGANALIISGNILYGTTSYGGSSSNGTVFAINTNGTDFTTIYSFTTLSQIYYNYNYHEVNSDGANPYGGLTLSGNTLYGTASNGGTNGDGTVFSISLALVVTTTSLPSGDDGVAYNQTLAAFGGQKPYNWTIISGVLPPGLTLATNGLISGIPTTNGGTFNFTVQVMDANTNTATQTLKLTVIPLQVTSTWLPDGTNFTAYSQQLNAIGGQPPYSWTLISGLLPSGLTLAPNGVISGTPATVGSFYFTVQVADADNNTATQALSLTIDPYVSMVASYSASESWSVTLFRGANDVATTFTGNETGILLITNGSFTQINHTGDAILPNPNTAMTIYYDDYSYNISGAYPFSGIGGGPIQGDLYAEIQLSFFVILVPLGTQSSIADSFPSDSSVFTTTGTSLTSLSGAGTMVDQRSAYGPIGPSYFVNKVVASSTSSLTEIVDTTPPTVTITLPTSGQKVSNNVFTVTGTSSDNMAVMDVFYSLNNMGLEMAMTTNKWTNWTAAVTLNPGTNTIAAFSVDTSGNVSATKTVAFDYVVSAPLTVQMTGRGTVTPNYSNQRKETSQESELCRLPR